MYDEELDPKTVPYEQYCRMRDEKDIEIEELQNKNFELEEKVSNYEELISQYKIAIEYQENQLQKLKEMLKDVQS